MSETNKQSEIVGRDFLPQGKAAYAVAHIALFDIRATLMACDMNESSTAGQKKVVSVVRNTINQISEYDDQGLFHPPLGYFSDKVKSELEYAEQDGAYKAPDESGLVNLDREKIEETSMMIMAIVRHGGSYSDSYSREILA